MKFLLLLGLVLSKACLGSSVEAQLDFDKYKKAFAFHFCIKAAEQKNTEIEHRCGKYGFGKDWQQVVLRAEIPCISTVTDHDREIASVVAHDMVHHLSDIAEWLKQNAQ